MKKYLVLVVVFLSVKTLAQKKEDEQAIKAMCGCYEIKFNFAETFAYPRDTSNYKASKVKHETALEWAEIIEDEPGKKSIQHLLIVGKGMIVKHWRQDWIFENKFDGYRALAQIENGICITVSDNGVGVSDKVKTPTQKMLKQQSIGISSIKERLEMINAQTKSDMGKLTITPGPNNRGTIAKICLPLLNQNQMA